MALRSILRDGYAVVSLRFNGKYAVVVYADQDAANDYAAHTPGAVVVPFVDVFGGKRDK